MTSSGRGVLATVLAAQALRGLGARKADEADAGLPSPTVGDQPGAADDASAVTFLTQRRLAHLLPDTRPLPSVAAYDQLLRRPRPAAAGGPGGRSDPPGAIP